MPYFSFDKIQIGPITIYILGLFIALGFLISLILVLKEAKKRQIDKNIIIDSFSWLLLGAIVGLRLGYVFQNLNYYFSYPIDVLKIWEGGMTFHGGLLGVITAGIIYAKIKKLSFLDFLRIADLIVLTVPLGIAVGRIGCTLINDHPGAITSLPWGIVWPDGIVRHPVAPYLIIANLAIFLILRKNRPCLNRPGLLFMYWLGLYSVMRLTLDFTRVGDPGFWFLSTAQWLSLGIIAIILVILISKHVRNRALHI